MSSSHRLPVDWDRRYATGWAYGKKPNDFLAEAAPGLPDGSAILCLGEGQGRNAVHLAKLGHACTAVDSSAVGLAKAAALAEQQGVSERVVPVVADLSSATYDPTSVGWQGVVSIFFALPQAQRSRLHRACAAALAPGGLFICECFCPAQVGSAEGRPFRAGPADASMLVSAADLVADFEGFEVLVAR